MKILAIDTATPTCSVAIVDQNRLLCEINVGKVETHSRHLMSMIQNALEWGGVPFDQIDGFAVIRGPGSFTGLRIGISSIKGFCLGLNRPVVGLSSLDVLAAQADREDCLICAMIDGRRQEVYTSRYRKKNGRVQKISPDQALDPESALADIVEPCLFMGNGALLYRKVILDRIGDMAFWPMPHQHVIRASTLAWMSLDRFESHDTDDPVSFAPIYIRKPDIWVQKTG
jgi:tRNA threonylcarbamoyladenosine biosynthesis protein TsaB